MEAGGCRERKTMSRERRMSRSQQVGERIAGEKGPRRKVRSWGGEKRLTNSVACALFGRPVEGFDSWTEKPDRSVHGLCIFGGSGALSWTPLARCAALSLPLDLKHWPILAGPFFFSPRVPPTSTWKGSFSSPFSCQVVGMVHRSWLVLSLLSTQREIRTRGVDLLI